MTPDGDSRQPERLNALGAFLFERYYLNPKGDLDDLNESIMAFCCAVALMPDEDSDKPPHLLNYANSLMIRHERLAQDSDFQQALSASGDAFKLLSGNDLSDNETHKPIHYKYLDDSCNGCFERIGEPGNLTQLGDLTLAISCIRCAVELMSDGHPDKPSYLATLGISYIKRFQQARELSDIEQAVCAYRSAVELTPDGHPDMLSHLNFLGISYHMRYESDGDIDFIEQSIMVHRRAVALMSDDCCDQPRVLHGLGNALLMRSVHTGNLDDLDDAIREFRRAVDVVAGEPKSIFHSNLGQAYSLRFDHTGDLEDLQKAISAHQRAIELVPQGQQIEQQSYFTSLSDLLVTRFKCTGAANDLEQATAMQRRAVELTPDDHPAKSWRLEGLSQVLLVRFKHGGDIDDLEHAIAILRSVAERTPDGHPHRPSRLCGLANSLSMRFKHKGEPVDLDEATTLFHSAVGLTPDDDSSKPKRLASLGSLYRMRFEHNGELGDLEQAILETRRAVELMPGDHRDPYIFSILGNSLMRRYDYTGDLEDLESCVSLHRHATELTLDKSADHQTMSSLFNGFGLALFKHFQQRNGELDELDGAIQAYRRALELIPEENADQSSPLSNLCVAFQTRFANTNELNDLTSAISAGRRAINMTPEGHTRLAGLYNTFASCLEQCAVYTKDFIQYLPDAVAMFHRAVELTPDGHPNLSVRLGDLGAAQLGIFQFQAQTQTNYDAAVHSFISSTMQLSAPPSQRLRAARRCVDMLTDYPAFSSSQALLLAHSRIMDVLPEMIWLGHDIHRRFDESAKLGELVNAAVSAAIDAGALGQAIEWLEAGRTLIWSQVLSLRTPLDNLKRSHPELAEPLQEIQQQLQSSAHSSFLPEPYSFGGIAGVTINARADRHRQLAIERAALLKKIRSCTGFEDFLLPKRLNLLVPAPMLRSGPVVFINVHSNRCDALIFASNGSITLVPLPNLSWERAEELRRLWTMNVLGDRVGVRGLGSIKNLDGELNPLKSYLGHVWGWIVQPVIAALRLPTDRLPHVTWCPTGPLMQLPLHAAGLYDDPNGPRAYNIVVSSYVPSLSVLHRSCNSAGESHSPRKVLIVTQPATPNHTPLPGTIYEGIRLKNTLEAAGITSEWFSDEVATVQGVRTVMDQYPWVHLACHGSQNRQDATQSAFELFDGPLTLSDLMATVANDAEFAFLSACKTAVGDEKAPEESAHLAAGMLTVGFKSVVATMWSIQDADAPIVVDAFYKKILALHDAEAVGRGSTGAAYALHEATRVLREEVGESAFMRWAPFVHFGV
ncbi:hypothetical protein PENSPDRAFT_641751 [Peniophora sp. CONT]|nr:hypothetical protein PENSPDRAFT_641751 [Peniophora sp. CONT]